MLGAQGNQLGQVLFELGESLLPARAREELTESFCAAGCRAFGGKRREELEALAETIESQYRTSA